MRQVALLLVALALVSFPAHATPGDGHTASGTDTCSNSATASQPCLRIDSPDQAASVTKRIYLYAAAAKCPPSTNTPLQPFGSCGGQPAKSVATGVPPLGILGLAYEESNGLDGLQRVRGEFGASAADGMLLL